MSFRVTVPERDLNEFFRHTRERLGRELTDIITPAHPIFQIMKDHGGIVDETPGRDLVEDIRFQVNDRGTYLSEGQKNGERNKEEVGGTTQLNFPWIMRIDDFILNYYDYYNATDVAAGVKLVKAGFDNIDQAMENAMVEIMWNGLTVGGKPVHGIRDFVQFDPTSAPTHGAIGGIDGTAAGVTAGNANANAAWRNRTMDYAGPYADFDTGARVSTMLTNPGGNSWAKMYRLCSSNPDGKSKTGQPNIILCNEPMMAMLEDLHDQRQIMRVGEKTEEQLGCPGFRFHNAVAIYDNDCPSGPDDPGDTDQTNPLLAQYGVAFFLNTNVLKWVWAKGIKKTWGELVKDPDKFLFQADEMTQFAMTIKDRRRCGVFYGAQPLA